MTKFISQTFLRGLAVVLPIAAAVYIVIWLGSDLERIIRGLLLQVMPQEFYVPGLGVALALGGVFLVGLLMYPWLTRKALDGVDTVLRKIPLFTSIYSPVRDLLNMLGGDVEEQLGQVVMVMLPGLDFEMLGFITRENTANLPPGMVPENHVVVLIPWSSQIGGLCYVVPKERVRPVEISVEEGLRWALTAGVSAPRGHAAESTEVSETKEEPV